MEIAGHGQAAHVRREQRSQVGDTEHVVAENEVEVARFAQPGCVFASEPSRRSPHAPFPFSGGKADQGTRVAAMRYEGVDKRGV